MERTKTLSQTPGQLFEKLRGIVAFLPSFQAPDFKFGHWTKPPSDQPGVMMLPYFSLSEVAGSFEQTAYDLGWVIRDFDWPTWKQTQEAISLRDDHGLAQATPEQLARLLTVCIRQDRFCEGALESAFESELLTRILEGCRHSSSVRAASAFLDGQGLRLPSTAIAGAPTEAAE